MLDDLATGLLGGLVGSRLGDKFLDREARRLQAEGRLECALRVVDGRQAGLHPTWMHGTATVSEGEIDLGGILLRVESVDGTSVRSPSFKEGWWINPRLKLIMVRSATAVLEWAVPDKQLAWAVATVSPHTLKAAPVVATSSSEPTTFEHSQRNNT